MKAHESNLYTSPESYLRGPDGMRNEATMWHVAAGLLMQESIARLKENLGGLHEDVGAKVRGDLPNISVLDVCCGPGTFANHISLIYPNMNVIGIDINSAFILAARKRFPQWTFIEADATALALGKSFDYVIGSSAYHHIPDSKKVEFLKAVAHHTNDNSRIILCDNFLPGGNRGESIEKYYSALKSYYDAGNSTPQARKCIDEVHALELSGEEEHKVTFERFKEDVRLSGLELILDIPVWQPDTFKKDNAGSHVLLLRRA